MVNEVPTNLCVWCSSKTSRLPTKDIGIECYRCWELRLHMNRAPEGALFKMLGFMENNAKT